jgi:hypothetical protein
VQLAAIVCADWSAARRGREVFAGRVEARLVERLDPPSDGWTVAAVLGQAQALARELDGAVLVGFDAALGVPQTYWARAPFAVASWATIRRFPDWLDLAARDPAFFEPAAGPEAWSVARPFYRVPPRPGGRRDFEKVLRAAGVEPLRRIEQLAGAQSVFVLGGVVGAVGAAAADLWRGLAEARTSLPRPRLWPFEAALDEPQAGPRVVVGEIYPRLAYGLALGEEQVEARGRLAISKNGARARSEALAVLADRPWVRRHGARLPGLDLALANADAFDALLSCAGLLRAVLEQTPLSRADLEDGLAEGGILGCGSLNLELPERRFQRRPKPRPTPRAPKPASRQARPARAVRRPPGRGVVVRIRASLREVAPEVWRRVVVPADFTLAELHHVLQAAFAWDDRHLHVFEIAGARYGPTHPDQPEEELDDSRYRVSDVLRPGPEAAYEYDFGDSWVHRLQVEAVERADPLLAYPVCTGGARACPPEDCGGPGGYERLLQALADPGHEEHVSLRRWVGGLFDPEGFDLNAVNRELARRRLRG